jgi:hypothetical protein
MFQKYFVNGFMFPIECSELTINEKAVGYYPNGLDAGIMP